MVALGLPRGPGEEPAGVAAKARPAASAALAREVRRAGRET